MSSHTSFGSSSESHHNHLHTIHGAPSLTRFSLSTSTFSPLSFTVYFLHSELYSELDNRSSWKACATPPTRRVRTPTTSPLPSHFPYEWLPGQPSCLIKNGKNIECNIDNHIPLVVPGAQATEHQTKSLGERKRTPAVGDHEQWVGTENTASTIHGRIDEVISTNHSWTFFYFHATGAHQSNIIHTYDTRTDHALATFVSSIPPESANELLGHLDEAFAETS